MTKKDYQVIADTIYEVYYYQQDTDGKGSKQIKQAAIKVLAESLADAFEYENSRFNRQKFYQACGFVNPKDEKLPDEEADMFCRAQIGEDNCGDPVYKEEYCERHYNHFQTMGVI